MLHLFPFPLPDECLYSLLCRYHIHSVNTSSAATLSEVLGVRSAIPDAVFPSHLRVLLDNLPTGSPLTLEQLVNRHTLFPYYRPFMDAHRLESTMSDMRGDDGRGIVIRLGLSAASIAVRSLQRFCPDCVEEDVQAYGEPYWHRAHQLPGVIICPKHALALRACDAHSLGVPTPRHELSLPRRRYVARHCPSILGSPKAPAHLGPQLLAFARISQALLDAQLPLMPPTLRDVYLHALADLRLVTHRGRVRQQQLHDRFSDAFPPMLLQCLEVPLGNHQADWLAKITRKPRGLLHPIRHLLMIQFAFGSLTRFVESVEAPISQQRYSRPRQSRRAVAAPEELHECLAVQKLSARKTADMLGCSVTTVVINAQRAGIPVSRRPKIRREKLEPAILKDASDGLTIAELVVKYNVPRSHLYRVIRAHPSAASARRMRNRDARIKECRNDWLRIVESTPRATQREVRQLCPATFAYLYRNDRQWLHESLPLRPTRQRSSAVRVDWIARDKEYEGRVKKAASLVRVLPGKPVRVTQTKLAKCAEIAPTFEKYHFRLPLTKRALRETSESYEEFEVRRIRWAVNTMHQAGEDLSPWRVERKTGLRACRRRVIKAEIYAVLELRRAGRGTARQR